jgi:hypothetical protein
MIDDNDVEIAILFWPSGGWIGFFLGIIVIGILAFVACQNDQECEAKSCPNGGVARLMDHECVCVERPQ